ncbi:hypothetical protein FACS189483_07650 [Spirochaetia bacterium]|nr:hypothetical protein FACS189483_07650 [Spirochaetia bacterium]
MTKQPPPRLPRRRPLIQNLTPRWRKFPPAIRHELRTVLSYMDQLLESLPEEKIEEFARSEYFDTYKKLFEDLGLV